jgi:hypothetical protein
MARTTFNWWRRNKKRKTLPKSAPLLDRIKNGDFDVSQYLEEANEEMATLNKLKQKEIERGKSLGLKDTTIRENVFKETDQYRRRYNRLMKDFYEDEDRILDDFFTAIKKRFGVSKDYLYSEWINKNQKDMTPLEVYYRCEELVNGNGNTNKNTK